MSVSRLPHRRGASSLRTVSGPQPLVTEVFRLQPPGNAQRPVPQDAQDCSEVHYMTYLVQRGQDDPIQVLGNTYF